MKEQLKQFIGSHQGVVVYDHDKNALFTGFLISFDELGLVIAIPSAPRITYFIPWHTVLYITPWE